MIMNKKRFSQIIMNKKRLTNKKASKRFSQKEEILTDDHR